MIRSIVVISALVFLSPIFASDWTYKGESKSVTVARSGEHFSGESVLRGTVSSDMYRVRSYETLELQMKPVPVVECRNEPGDGKGDWKGFYSVPRYKKAEALADAIKGVGTKTSDELVPYFDGRRKPRTWREFSDIIRSADKQIGHGLASRVLGQYGNDNMRALGYYSDQDCTVQYVNEPQLVLVEKQERQFISTKVAPFEVRVDGKLLAGEQESFIATFDGFNLNVSPSSYYNRYHLASRQTFRAYSGDVESFEFRSQRIGVTPRATVSLSLGVTRVGGFDIQVFNPEAAVDTRVKAYTTVEAIVKRVRKFWVDEEVASFTLDATKGSSTQHVSFRPKRGETYYVEYRTRKINSEFYNGSAKSDKKETSKISF